MNVAIITAGGVGDVLQSCSASTILRANGHHSHIYVNSHKEILEFINKCTEFDAFPCPERTVLLPDIESPLNLAFSFLDRLHKDYHAVYSCWPDSLQQAPFAFPWFKYCRSYQEFVQTRVKIRGEHSQLDRNKKHIFIHATSVTLEKNMPLQNLQVLVNELNKTNYEVVIARTSSWKGNVIPFFLQGRFIDLVDMPIDYVISTLLDSDYFIGVDSAFAHCAYHIGIPRVILQQHFNQCFHTVRYHETCHSDLPLNSSPETILNRVLLNLREPRTTTIPAYMNIPHNINTKQLLYTKYYD